MIYIIVIVKVRIILVYLLLKALLIMICGYIEFISIWKKDLCWECFIASGNMERAFMQKNENTFLPDVIFSFPKVNEMSFDAFGKLYEDAKRVLELRLFI
jgi:hypothetical protein